LLSQTLHQGDHQNALQEVIQLKNGLDEANTELRELLAHFRVRMDERGLIPATENLVERFKKESDIAVFFQTDCSQLKLPPLVEVQVLHIIQESLTNIRKHSQAENVRVLIRCDDEDRYHVLIEDDGIGIESTTIEGQPGEHVGLSIMKERARRIGGELIIETEPGEGTRVEFDINCANPNVQADLEPFKYTRTLPETIISGKITTR
jgi:two-component system nitrate/nitrite sensor histidine kinase NarX